MPNTAKAADTGSVTRRAPHTASVEMQVQQPRNDNFVQQQSQQQQGSMTRR